MEFSSRGFQRNNTRPTSANATTPQGSTNTPELNGNGPVHKKAYHKIKSSRIGSILGGVLFVSIIILIVAIIFGVSTRSSERSYVNGKDYQAVFLEGGQVYFGKVKNLNDSFINLVDIYYLNVDNQNVQPESSSSQQNLSLVKLGCELHGPKDQMIINRDRVTFWENLKSDSKVSKAIKQWQEQNKNGQDCDQQSATQQPSGNEAQNSTNSNNTSSNDNEGSQNNSNANNSTSNSNSSATPNSSSNTSPSTSTTPSNPETPTTPTP